MRYLVQNTEMHEAETFLHESEQIALHSTCLRSRCGSVIVQRGEVIGKGYNSPPDDSDSQRRCLNDKQIYHSKVTDKTCCVHAEQRAIIDALRHNPDALHGSRLYFIRLNEEDKASRAGRPYCTICSKMALDVGIQEFVLWHEEGVAVYDTAEYNTLSFNYSE